MLCKYYLMIGSDKVDIKSESCMDVSSMISNLNDLKLSYSRVDYGGVTRKCGSNIEFVGDARNAIVDYFSVNGRRSVASFAVYGIENDWTYTEIFSCPLDFSSFEYDSYVATLSCIDNSVASKIKANNNTQYEYNAAELKAAKQLEYDRLSIGNEVSMQAIGSEEYEGEDTHSTIARNVWWTFPRLGIVNEEIPSNHSVLIQDSPEVFQTDGTPMGWGFPAMNRPEAYFLECIEDCVVTIDFSNLGIVTSSRNPKGCVLAKLSDGVVTPLNCSYSSILPGDEFSSLSQVKWSGPLRKGDKLQFAVYNYYHELYDSSGIVFEARKSGFVSWSDRQDPIYFDVIKPNVLLGKLIESICPNMVVKSYIKETIDNEGIEVDNIRLQNTMLCPAECVRQFKEAKLYTSFNDFCLWMEATFGYVYEITEMAETAEGIIQSSIYDFDGFVEQFNGVSNTEHSNLKRIVFCYTERDYSDGRFAGEYELPWGDPYKSVQYSTSFLGNESYQLYEKGDTFGYKVKNDVFFRNTAEFVIYQAENGKVPNYTEAGSFKWTNTLHEAELQDIDRNHYTGTLNFGMITSDDVTDLGVYPGTVNESNICFCRKLKRFAYYDNGYYLTFNGSEYMNGGNTRTDIIYKKTDTGQNYIFIKDCLTKCVLSENIEEVKYPTVVFRHRNEVFQNLAVIGIDDIADFKYKLATERLYARLNIGYEKKDYDLGNNGKDEFNFKSVYTTGITLDDKELNMVSPYRADSYGMEELAAKIGQDTSSSGSDKQIFAVYCSEEQNEYVVSRDSVVTGVGSDTIFNTSLSVLEMIEANRRYLASFAEKLTFVSTDGNSSAIIDGVMLSGDVELSNPLFKAGNISFSTNSLIVPEQWNGYVEIPFDGKTIRGYISSLEINVSREETFEYELIEC